MKQDLVLSCFAGARVPAGVPFEHPIRVIQWDAPASSGHPSWTAAADRLRAAPWRKGPLLRALLATFGVRLADVGRIAVIGFSAGSNNGIRELLRSDEDRARIDVALAVDGLHPNLAASPGEPPRGAYADWQAELEPFAAMAERAALGHAAMVATASDVAAPSAGNGKTARVLADLVSELAQRTASAPLGAPALPPNFPSSGDPYRPTSSAERGGFSALWYPGTDKTAHILQGTAVIRDLWRDVLSRRWSPGTIAALTSSTSSAPARPVISGPTVPRYLPGAVALASVAGLLLTR
jgi:hypothetical protein